MWNLRKDPAEGPLAAKWMHAYCSSLLASCPDSNNVGMSPLQTGPFALMHGGELLSFKNSMQTDIPHPHCQIHPAYWPSHKWHGTVRHYTSWKSKNKIRITSSFVSCTWMYPVKLIIIKGLEVSWYSLEQYILLYCRQAFNYFCSLLHVWKDTEMQALIWGLKCLLSMLRCMLGSVKGVKSENPKGEGEIRKWKRGCYSKGVFKLIY